MMLLLKYTLRIIFLIGLRSGIAKSYNAEIAQQSSIVLGKEKYDLVEHEFGGKFIKDKNVSEIEYEEEEDTNIIASPEERGRFWWTFRNRTSNQNQTKGNDISQKAKENNPLNNTLNFISNLFRYVILNQNSASRVQFFNANYKRNNTFNETSPPRAVFGSPLCLGICGISQIYWTNSSVDFLSGNKFPFPTLGPPSAPRPPAIG